MTYRLVFDIEDARLSVTRSSTALNASLFYSYDNDSRNLYLKKDGVERDIRDLSGKIIDPLDREFTIRLHLRSSGDDHAGEMLVMRLPNVWTGEEYSEFLVSIPRVPDELIRRIYDEVTNPKKVAFLDIELSDASPIDFADNPGFDYIWDIDKSDRCDVTQYSFSFEMGREDYSLSPGEREYRLTGNENMTLVERMLLRVLDRFNSMEEGLKGIGFAIIIFFIFWLGKDLLERFG